jgi:hypothetical protein
MIIKPIWLQFPNNSIAADPEFFITGPAASQSEEWLHLWKSLDNTAKREYVKKYPVPEEWKFLVKVEDNANAPDLNELVTLVETTLSELQKIPEKSTALESVIQQLIYLQAVGNDEETDYSKKDKLCIGVTTAKMLADDLDEAIVDNLYFIDEFAHIIFPE